MEEIFKQYGRIIIASVVCVAILIAISLIRDPYGNVGLFNVLAYHMVLKEDNMDALTDDDATKTSVDKPAPTISYDGIGLEPLTCGSEVNLFSYFKVKYYDSSSDAINTERANISGNYSIVLKSIYDSKGNDITLLLDDSTGNIVFPYSDVYVIKFRVIDSLNQFTSSTFEIPVDIS